MADFPVKPEVSEPVSRHLNIGVGGRVKYFFTPESEKELVSLVKFLYNSKARGFILGGGTNVIAREKIGAKIVISMNKIHGLNVLNNSITAWAGEKLAKVVMKAAKSGLSGLEPLAGIPGTVGGAVKMNAGGKYGDISGALKEVDTIDAAGRKRTFRKEEMKFSYRKGPFEKRIITRAVFKLRKKGDAVLEKTRKILEEKARTQPLGARSAGCVFLNPPGTSAGLLIDQAGLKGAKVGDAEVSKVHANYIVTGKNAKSSDVFRLIKKIQKTVYAKSGIKLKTEVICLE